MKLEEEELVFSGENKTTIISQKLFNEMVDVAVMAGLRIWGKWENKEEAK